MLADLNVSSGLNLLLNVFDFGVIELIVGFTVSPFLVRDLLSPAFLDYLCAYEGEG